MLAARSSCTIQSAGKDVAIPLNSGRDLIGIPESPAAVADKSSIPAPPGPLEVDAAIAHFPGLVCLRAGPGHSYVDLKQPYFADAKPNMFWKGCLGNMFCTQKPNVAPRNDNFIPFQDSEHPLPN